MTKIDIYTKTTCPYCLRAKTLLYAKGASFNEIVTDNAPDKREEMIARSGRTSVPQIFINGQHIGGCDDLHALDAQNRLDPLLK